MELQITNIEGIAIIYTSLITLGKYPLNTEKIYFLEVEGESNTNLYYY